MVTIAVIGSVNADMILQVERAPRPGETVLNGVFATARGGKGANQAVAAARAGGAAVTMVARVGNDAFGRDAVEGFTSEGIDTRYVVQDKAASTGVALIFVDKKGENSIGVASGANFSLGPKDIRSASTAIASSDALLIQLEVPNAAVEAAVDIAASNNVPIILNPAPARRLPPGLLRKISILTPNRLELEALSGMAIDSDESIAAAVEHVRGAGAGTVIVTLGAQGVLVFQEGETFRVDAHPVNAIDTTAAGDVFNGALSVALAEGQPLQEAVAFANAAAALSVTRIGAQSSIPLRAEIDAFVSSKESKAIAT